MEMEGLLVRDLRPVGWSLYCDLEQDTLSAAMSFRLPS